MYPSKGYLVSFGNDCWHCADAPSCSKYGELTNPEEEKQDKEEEEWKF